MPISWSCCPCNMRPHAMDMNHVTSSPLAIVLSYISSIQLASIRLSVPSVLNHGDLLMKFFSSNISAVSSALSLLGPSQHKAIALTQVKRPIRANQCPQFLRWCAQELETAFATVVPHSIKSRSLYQRCQSGLLLAAHAYHVCWVVLQVLALLGRPANNSSTAHISLRSLILRDNITSLFEYTVGEVHHHSQPTSCRPEFHAFPQVIESTDWSSVFNSFSLQLKIFKDNGL